MGKFHCPNCNTDDPVFCVCIELVTPESDPTKQAVSRDKGQAWTVTTIGDWQEYNWQQSMIVKPASYVGSSFNGYSGLRVMAAPLTPATAGSGTPWEVIPAGKAVQLPPGRYFLRADLFPQNQINVRIYPAGVTRQKWLSRAFLLPPSTVGVGAASGLALAARVSRTYLYLKNTSASAVVSISFGPNAVNPAVLNQGITLNPGEWVSLWGDDCPEEAVNAISSLAGSGLAIQEG